MSKNWPAPHGQRRYGTAVHSARPSARVFVIPLALLVALTYWGGAGGFIFGLAVAAFLCFVLFRQGVRLEGDWLTYRGIFRSTTVRLKNVKDALVVDVVRSTARTRNIVIRGHEFQVLLRVQDSVANPQTYAIEQMLRGVGKRVTVLDPVKPSELERAIPGASGWMEKRGSAALVNTAVILGIFALAAAWAFLGTRGA